MGTVGMDWRTPRTLLLLRSENLGGLGGKVERNFVCCDTLGIEIGLADTKAGVLGVYFLRRAGDFRLEWVAGFSFMGGDEND